MFATFCEPRCIAMLPSLLQSSLTVFRNLVLSVTKSQNLGVSMQHKCALTRFAFVFHVIATDQIISKDVVSSSVQPSTLFCSAKNI